jgi:hypothetical protein
MTIGTVLAVIAGLMAVCVSLWALLVGAALLFPEKVELSRDGIERSPWRAFWIGLALQLTLGLIGAGMMRSPNGGAKLLGFLLSTWLTAMMTVGAGGLACLIGERIRRYDAYMTAFGATMRGAGLMVGAMLVPLFGWFAVMPFILLVSLGAGFQAFFHGVRLFARPKDGAEPVS